jgi:hypothetical protein
VRGIPAWIEELGLPLVFERVARDYPEEAICMLGDKIFCQDNREGALAAPRGDGGDYCADLLPTDDPFADFDHIGLVFTELH